MKKVSIFMAVAVAVGLASCTAQSPKANLKTGLDSLTYAAGMSRTNGLVPYLVQAGIDTTYMAEFIKGLNEGASKKEPSAKEKAYEVGVQIGMQVGTGMVMEFNQQIYGADTTRTVSKENYVAGFVAGTLGKDTTIMTMAAAQTFLQMNGEMIKAKVLAETFAEYKAENEKYLADNKSKEGVQTTPSGLQYKVITAGTGEIPADTSTVKVNYKGSMIDGTEFDSSYKRNEPATFPVNQVIKGWTEALTMMPVGSKWELYVPQDIAYGAGQSGQIKPYSTLIFEVELLEIVK